MPPKLSPLTEALVMKLFKSSEVDEVTYWLETECGNNLPFYDRANEFEMERVRFAVLKLSKGNLRKLLLAIDQARMDWRDLFMAADFGYDTIAHEKWAKETLST